MKQRNLFLEILYAVLPAVSIACLLVLWMGVSGNRPDLIPTPAETWSRFADTFDKPIMRLSFFGHILASLRRVMTALLISWSAGILFGILIGWSRTGKSVFGSIFNMLRPIPPLAWIPLITIWFGIGETPKILIVVIGSIVPVIVNTQSGMERVEQLYLDVGTVFHANSRQILFEIAVPSALPTILAGIKTSISTGWMVVLAAEMLGAKSGVGFLITRGMDSGDTALVLVAMIAIGIVGALLAVFISFVERMICPWLRKK